MPSEQTDRLDASPRADRQPPSLWRNANFLLLWCGDAISALGSQASQLALPLLALALAGSPAQAGYLGAIRGAIYLLSGLPAGALIDRWHRRAVLVGADLLRALAFASIPLAAALGQLTMAQLYAVVALEGLCFVAFGRAHAASTARIVPPAQIPAALARSQAVESLARTLGPLIGGTLFAASRLLPFLADAATYLLSAVLILAIRTPVLAVYSIRPDFLAVPPQECQGFAVDRVNGQHRRHRALLRARLPLLRPPAPASVRLDRRRPARHPDLRRRRRRRPRRPPRRSPRPHPLTQTRPRPPLGGLGNALARWTIQPGQATWTAF